MRQVPRFFLHSKIALLAGLTLAAAIAGYLALSPGSAAAGPPEEPPGLARALAAQAAHTDALISLPGVAGTAVGLSADEREAAVLVLTSAGGVRGIPATLDGVRVRVVVTGPLEALSRQPMPAVQASRPQAATARYARPVPIGVSTGHPAITAGTIGARVKKSDGTVYALSNNHVYAVENQAAIGDNVLQPGAYDGGVNPGDAIGTLSAFVPIVFSTSASNTVDAAIALSSTGNLGNSTLANGYGTPKSTIAAAAINQRVMKYGRTSQLTKGKVWGINATVNVGYGSGVARFVGQILVSPGAFSRGGDSGSLIVVNGGSNDRKPVGLVFAGSPSVTVANPIGAVLTAFGVTIDGAP